MGLLFDGSVLSVATVELITGEDVDLDVVGSPEDKVGLWLPLACVLLRSLLTLEVDSRRCRWG